MFYCGDDAVAALAHHRQMSMSRDGGEIHGGIMAATRNPVASIEPAHQEEVKNIWLTLVQKDRYRTLSSLLGGRI